MDAGYWQSDYWPDRYWMADYWPEYGTEVTLIPRMWGYLHEELPKAEVSFLDKPGRPAFEPKTDVIFTPKTGVTFHDDNPEIEYEDDNPEIRVR